MTSATEGELETRRGHRMSLNEWLVSNVIPDSNALNKAYLRSMRRRKRTPAFSCDLGEFWFYFYKPSWRGQVRPRLTLITHLETIE